jgi:hypothetical protein
MAIQKTQAHNFSRAEQTRLLLRMAQKTAVPIRMQVFKPNRNTRAPRQSQKS